MEPERKPEPTFNNFGSATLSTRSKIKNALNFFVFLINKLGDTYSGPVLCEMCQSESP